MTSEPNARVLEKLEHMLGAIQRIESYVKGLSLKSFHENALAQDAVIRNFEIIGEAANKSRSLDANFAAAHPELKLDIAYRMRNALVHGYDAVNLVTLWNTSQSDLPDLKYRLQKCEDVIMG